MLELIDPLLRERIDRDGLSHVFSRVVGPSAFEPHFVGRILGLSIFEEHLAYNQAIADHAPDYVGFLTNMYDRIITHTQNPQEARLEIMKRTQKGGFSRYLSSSNQIVSDALYAKLEKCDVPRLFAAQFRGFSVAGSDFANLVRTIPRGISPEDFRIHLRDFYIREIQPDRA